MLEKRPSSLYALYFDIDWLPAEEKLRNKVLVPTLGDHYGRVLTRREIRVERREGSFFIRYSDHSLPAAPRFLAYVLSNAATRISSNYLSFLAENSYVNLPWPTSTDHASIVARHRDKEIVRALVGRFCGESPSASATNRCGTRPTQ